MKRIKKEPIHETSFNIEGLSFSIRGKIFYDHKIQNHPYSWDVSHYYYPTSDSGLSYPSSAGAASEKEAVILMEQYISQFRPERIEANALF